MVSPFFNLLNMLYFIRTTRETEEFIEKYLDERGYSSKNPIIIQRAWEEINIDFKRPGVNPDDVAKYIKVNMSYDDYSPIFTPTLYWTIIADWVKLLHKYICAFQWKHNITKYPDLKFVAHHPDYDKIHGYELQLVHELICLCESCHEKCHANEPKGMRRSEKTIIIQDNDMFKSSLISKKYIAYQIAVIRYLVETKKFHVERIKV